MERDQPLGALQVDAYDGPLRLEIQLSRVDQIRATQLATDPAQLDGVVDRVSADLRDAVEKVAWLTALAAVSGGTAAYLLVLRRRREPLIALGLSTALVAATGGVAAATWRPEALSQPTYTGLLVNANSLIGSAEDIVARFDAYRSSLEDLVANDQEFHRRIALGSGNSVLASLIESFSGPLHRARVWRGLTQESATSRTLDEHRAIQQAMAERQHDVARAWAQVHVAGVEQWLRSVSADRRSGAGPPAPAA